MTASLAGEAKRLLQAVFYLQVQRPDEGRPFGRAEAASEAFKRKSIRGIRTEHISTLIASK